MRAYELKGKGMARYIVVLSTQVNVVATAEIIVEAESIDDAKVKVKEEAKKLETEYLRKHRLYNLDPLRNDYPSKPFCWYVDQDDVDGNADLDDAEVDEVKEADEE